MRRLRRVERQRLSTASFVISRFGVLHAVPLVADAHGLGVHVSALVLDALFSGTRPTGQPTEGGGIQARLEETLALGTRLKIAIGIPIERRPAEAFRPVPLPRARAADAAARSGQTSRRRPCTSE
jgi:hypothetical protein